MRGSAKTSITGHVRRVLIGKVMWVGIDWPSPTLRDDPNGVGRQILWLLTFGQVHTPSIYTPFIAPAVSGIVAGRRRAVMRPPQWVTNNVYNERSWRRLFVEATMPVSRSAMTR